MTPAHARTRSSWLGRRHLVSWGRLEVPSYTAMLYLGCVAGVLAGAAVADAAGLDPTRFALAATVLLVPAFLGARLWFVLASSAEFRTRPRHIWRRSEGGWTLYGGLLAAFALSAPLLALAGMPFWEFWDAASVSMLVALILGRFGCTMNGCCVGRATSGPVGLWLPDHRGLWRRRIPTQLLEAGWAVLALAGALAAHRHLPFAGALFLGAVATYAAARLGLERTREPGASAVARRANLVASAVLLAGCALTVLAGWPA